MLEAWKGDMADATVHRIQQMLDESGAWEALHGSERTYKVVCTCVPHVVDRGLLLGALGVQILAGLPIQIVEHP